MKKVLKAISAATTDNEDTRVPDTLKQMEADFDYIQNGVEKLVRQGVDTSDILQTLHEFDLAIQETIDDIASIIAE